MSVINVIPTPEQLMQQQLQLQLIQKQQEQQTSTSSNVPLPPPVNYSQEHLQVTGVTSDPNNRRYYYTIYDNSGRAILYDYGYNIPGNAFTTDPAIAQQYGIQLRSGLTNTQAIGAGVGAERTRVLQQESAQANFGGTRTQGILTPVGGVAPQTETASSIEAKRIYIQSPTAEYSSQSSFKQALAMLPVISEPIIERGTIVSPSQLQRTTDITMVEKYGSDYIKDLSKISLPDTQKLIDVGIVSVVTQPGQYGYHATPSNPAGIIGGHQIESQWNMPTEINPATGQRYTTPDLSYRYGYDIGSNTTQPRQANIGFDVNSLFMTPIKKSTDEATEKLMKGIDEWQGFIKPPSFIRDPSAGREFINFGKIMLESAGQLPQFGVNIATGVEIAATHPKEFIPLATVGTGIIAGQTVKSFKEDPLKTTEQFVAQALIFQGIAEGAALIRIPTVEGIKQYTPKIELPEKTLYDSLSQGIPKSKFVGEIYNDLSSSIKNFGANINSALTRTSIEERIPLTTRTSYFEQGYMGQISPIEAINLKLPTTTDINIALGRTSIKEILPQPTRTSYYEQGFVGDINIEPRGSIIQTHPNGFPYSNVLLDVTSGLRGAKTFGKDILTDIKYSASERLGFTSIEKPFEPLPRTTYYESGFKGTIGDIPERPLKGSITESKTIELSDILPSIKEGTIAAAKDIKESTIDNAVISIQKTRNYISRNLNEPVKYFGDYGTYISPEGKIRSTPKGEIKILKGKTGEPETSFDIETYRKQIQANNKKIFERTSKESKQRADAFSDLETTLAFQDLEKTLKPITRSPPRAKEFTTTQLTKEQKTTLAKEYNPKVGGEFRKLDIELEKTFRARKIIQKGETSSKTKEGQILLTKQIEKVIAEPPKPKTRFPFVSPYAIMLTTQRKDELLSGLNNFAPEQLKSSNLFRNLQITKQLPIEGTSIKPIETTSTKEITSTTTSFAQISANINAQANISIEKQLSGEVSKQSLREIQKEMLGEREIIKPKPLLVAFPEQLPEKKKKKKTQRPSKSYLIKNPFPTLDEVLGTPTRTKKRKK